MQFSRSIALSKHFNFKSQFNDCTTHTVSLDIYNVYVLLFFFQRYDFLHMTSISVTWFLIRRKIVLFAKRKIENEVFTTIFWTKVDCVVSRSVAFMWNEKKIWQHVPEQILFVSYFHLLLAISIFFRHFSVLFATENEEDEITMMWDITTWFDAYSHHPQHTSSSRFRSFHSFIWLRFILILFLDEKRRRRRRQQKRNMNCSECWMSTKWSDERPFLCSSVQLAKQ